MTIKHILISTSSVSLNPLAAHWWNTSRGTETSITLKFYSTENMRGADLSTSSGRDIHKSTLTGVQVTSRKKRDWSWGKNVGMLPSEANITDHVCLFVFTLCHHIIPSGTTHSVLQSHKKVNIFLIFCNKCKSLTINVNTFHRHNAFQTVQTVYSIL